MKTLVSCVCRAELSREILQSVSGVGIHPLPPESMPYRQITICPEYRGEIPAVLKWHRDTFVPTVIRGIADKMIADGWAAPASQSLLVYAKETYLLDHDVQAMPDEWERVNESDCMYVVVAVIGENRSALAVCRNVVSGCQDAVKLVDDAKGAIESSLTILVED